MKLNTEGLLTEAQAAEALSVSLPCLRRWRRLGIGPRAARLSRLIRYEPSAVREFVERSTVRDSVGGANQ